MGESCPACDGKLYGKYQYCETCNKSMAYDILLQSVNDWKEEAYKANQQKNALTKELAVCRRGSPVNTYALNCIEVLQKIKERLKKGHWDFQQFEETNADIVSLIDYFKLEI